MNLLLKTIQKFTFAGLFLGAISSEAKLFQCKKVFESIIDNNKRPVIRHSLTRQKYVHYIDFDSKLNGHVGLYNILLTGSFKRINSIPQDAREVDGIYYAAHAYPYLQSFSSNFNGETITFQKARELFEIASSMESIAWNEISEGCAARAHLMSRKFESMGIYVDKAWLGGNIFMMKNDEDINWDFHVAPVVYARSAEGEVEKLIIDPAVFNGPVSVSSWVNELNIEGYKIFQTSYPLPYNSRKVKRISLAFSNSKPYSFFYNLLQDRKTQLKSAEKEMNRFKKCELDRE